MRMFRDFICGSRFENTYGFARTSQGEMAKYSIVYFIIYDYVSCWARKSNESILLL